MPITENTRTLSEEELDERVAVLTKLRESLLKQREKFKKYLEVLEHEEQDILTDDAEKLQAHTEIENSIVQEIYTFQKIIDPLDDMYRIAYPSKDPEIPKLKLSLEKIRNQVVQRSKRNQQLLKDRMNGIRNEIRSIRKVYKNRPVYDSHNASSTMIDIST